MKYEYCILYWEANHNNSNVFFLVPGLFFDWQRGIWEYSISFPGLSMSTVKWRTDYSDSKSEKLEMSESRLSWTETRLYIGKNWNSTFLTIHIVILRPPPYCKNSNLKSKWKIQFIIEFELDVFFEIFNKLRTILNWKKASWSAVKLLVSLNDRIHNMPAGRKWFPFLSIEQQQWSWFSQESVAFMDHTLNKD